MGFELLENARGKEIIICGAGPSLNKFDTSLIKEGCYIALNKAFMKTDIEYDAVVSGDYTAIQSVKAQLLEKKDMVKFFCDIQGPEASRMPKDYYDMPNVVACKIKDDIETECFDGKFPEKITKDNLRYHQSIASTAVQIALYYKPRKLYLVGFDFSDEGHYDESFSGKEDIDRHKMWVQKHWDRQQVRAFWRAIADWARIQSPDTKIISINPVTLKGIFEDIFVDVNVPKITAYIAVKENSVRLPGKNKLPFADSNLLIHKIRQLKQIRNINEIVVSTDSYEMLKMAEDEGVTAIKRPKELADESKPYQEYVRYLVDILPGEHIMRCPVTAPLCDADVIMDAVTKYFEVLDKGYDSLTSVTKFQNHMLDENGPMNFSTGRDHKGSQNLPVWHEIANCMDIEPKEVMRKSLFQYGTKVYRYEVDEISAVDIDNRVDYDIACAIYEYWKKHDLSIK